MKSRGVFCGDMTPWERRYVGDLIDELERYDRIPASVADRARVAVEQGRYREALDMVLTVGLDHGSLSAAGFNGSGRTRDRSAGPDMPIVSEE